MKNIISKVLLLGVAAGGSFQFARAQYRNTTAQEDPAYVKVIQERVAKIVAPLHLKDGAKQQNVQQAVAQQYYDLNRIDLNKEKSIAAIKSSNIAKEAQKDSVTAINTRSDAAIAAIHPEFVGRLNELLNKDQVAEVKDGMTYHTLEVTYKAYTEMLPNLTKDQKTQIMAWLEEAREHAIDGGSSKEKHAWFGKYKGRINNYLAKAGIDMKEAENAWKKRTQSAKL